jgi:hypothetical protein
MPDLVTPTIIIIALVVLLGIPEFFWNILKVFVIVACAIGMVYLMGELALAAPLVVLAFLAGAAVTGAVLMLSKQVRLW